MLTILFCLALVWLIWKMVLLGLKLTWGIAGIVVLIKGIVET